MAEDAWNTRDPAGGARLYAGQPLAQSRRIHAGPRRDRGVPARKWARELDYRLIKEIWAFRDNRIAVRFAYEWRDDSGHWFRSYGNENWEFDEAGDAPAHRQHQRSADREAERKYHWPLGRRPDDHPGLSELGL